MEQQMSCDKGRGPDAASTQDHASETSLGERDVHTMHDFLRDHQIPFVFLAFPLPRLVLVKNRLMVPDEKTFEQLVADLMEQRQITQALPSDMSPSLDAAVMLWRSQTLLLVRHGMETEKMCRMLAALLHHGRIAHLVHLGLVDAGGL